VPTIKENVISVLFCSLWISYTSIPSLNAYREICREICKTCRERLHTEIPSGPTLPPDPRKVGASCTGLPIPSLTAIRRNYAKLQPVMLAYLVFISSPIKHTNEINCHQRGILHSWNSDTLQNKLNATSWLFSFLILGRGFYGSRNSIVLSEKLVSYAMCST
jgi:hypothetical protein